MGLMNFQDWVVERQRLLNRIKELEAENTELKKRLGKDISVLLSFRVRRSELADKSQLQND